MGKKCIDQDCNKQSSYNFEYETKAIYCKKHRKNDMIDVVSKKCIDQDCTKQPLFNFLNETKGIYCKEHRKEGMIDIKHKKCIDNGCNKQPLYNFEHGKKAIYCKSHRFQNMIYIVNKNKQCIEKDCTKKSSFNFPNETRAIYCKKHCNEGMIDVVHKKCIQEYCDIQVSNNKYKGNCLKCFMHLFPNEKISKNYKIKEQHVIDFIKQEYSNQDWIFDKQVDNGCSRRRPDCVLDLYTHVLIIECDENQHSSYQEICENKRSMELFQDFGNRPIIFIRFNPDSYDKKPSSFKYHKALSIPMIRNIKEWNMRLSRLKDTINNHITNIPEREVTIEYLFYDSSY